MKNYLYLFITLILFYACASDDSPSFTAQTEADIIQYIADKNLNATRTDSGLYYVVNNEGTGEQPTESSIVDVKLKASFLDGTVKSDTESAILNTTAIIEGLKEGIQLFKTGGEGTIIVPYQLAYGEVGNFNGSIPGGTVLVFDIKITAVYDDYESQNEAAIKKYISDNNLTATRTDSGLYYVINNEGTGTRPTNNSNVTVAYKGYYLNDNVFEQSEDDGISFGLDGVIKGWTEGIPLFKEGGDGTLLIPSKLGYGDNGRGTIPGGSVLVFDITLISVN